MITYQVEDYFTCVDDIRPLLTGHYEEIATDRDVIPLCMDTATYAQMARDGQLHIVTVRLDGVVIGYHVTLVKTHLHYQSTLCGFTDVYYLAPEHRRGHIGLKMFEFVEKTLAERGVVKLFTGTKLHFDMSKLFERMGWTPTEQLFTKVINGRDDTASPASGRGC